MRRLIPTIVLVVLCIGGFWYASSQDFFKEKTQEAPALVTVKKEEVASYTVKNGVTETVLERKDGGWTMTKPTALPLDSSSADAWVDTFVSVKKDKVVTAAAAELEQFGLAAPKQMFTVKLVDGGERTLAVGDLVPVGGSYYAKLGDAPEVFQLAESTVKSLAKQPVDFMEKRAVKVEYEKVRALTVDWKGAAWTLTKTEPDKSSFESKWKLGERELTGTDATGFLDRAASLVTEQQAKRASEVQGLDQPDLRIELKVAGEAAGAETTVAYAGKAAGDVVWISQQGGEWAFAVPTAAVQELADKAKAAP